MPNFQGGGVPRSGGHPQEDDQESQREDERQLGHGTHTERERVGGRTRGEKRNLEAKRKEEPQKPR